MNNATRFILCGASLLLGGCSIRAVAVVETEDAVYGTTEVKKEQKYDAHQQHLGFFESLMGTLNSDTIDALGRIANGQPAPAVEPRLSAPTVVTPLPAGSSVLVHP